MLKKIILVLLSSLILFQSNITYVAAQTATWYDQNIFDWYVKVYDQNTSQPQEIFGERYTAAQVQWIMYGLIVFMLNMVFDSSFTACILKAELPLAVCLANPTWLVNKLNAVLRILTYAAPEGSSALANQAPSRSIFEFFGNKIFEQRELSGIAYVKNAFDKLTLVPAAHAQQAGYGYGALSVLQPLWSKSRDITYALLIFAAIIMAFMIMFRTKISPQTVITVQSAIPKLVIAIILITFSYAIAGLMVDLVYVVIGFIAAIFGGADTTKIQTIYNIMTAGPGNQGIFGLLLFYAVCFPIFFIVAISNIFPIISDIGPLLAVFFILMLVIVGLLMLFAYLRALFMLIKTLVSVYLLVVFGPFYVLGGVVTSSLGFGNWLKDLAANLAVFPAVGLMFVLAWEFMSAAAQNLMGLFPNAVSVLFNDIFQKMGGTQQFTGISGSSWAPPLLGIGSQSGNLMLLFVSLGIILMVPKVADVIKGFMSGRPFAYGTAIGESVTGAVGGTTALYGGGSKAVEYTKNKFAGLRGLGKSGPQAAS